MGYRENETNSLQPVEGIEFRYGDTVWRITPYYRTLYIAGLRFDAEPMSRGPLRSGAELSDDEVEVTIKTSHAVVTAFLASDKLLPFKVTIYRGHLGGSASEYAIVFRGDVTEIDKGRLFTTFTVANVRHIIETEIPTYTFQAVCNHQLYGTRCKVVREDYTTTVVLGDSGPYWGVERRIASTEIGAKPDGYYRGGVLSFTDSTGKVHRRQIVDTNPGGGGFFHIYDPDTIPEFSPPTGLTVDLTAGCDHLYGTCFGRFNNTRNFGGFPFMRTRDPQRGII